MKESIKNVLDMYKEGTLSPEDAEKLIDALWDGGENGPAVPWANDNKLRVVAYRGRRLVKRGEAGDRLFELKIEGDVNDLECWGSAECGTVFGNASSGGGMTVQEGVAGNASSGGGMQIGGDVVGNAAAGGGFSAGGSIGGRVSAGGSVTCKGDINGAVTTGGNVEAETIEGDVRARSVRCASIGGRVDEYGSGQKRPQRDPGEKTEDPFADEGFRQSIRNAESISGVDISSMIQGALGMARDAMEKERAGMQSENGSKTVTVETDGDLEIAVLQNGELIASADACELVVRLEGDVENVRSEIAVTVEGDVGGDVSVGDRGQVTCGDVGGNVTAGGQVTCGDVGGNASAGGQVTCECVEGDASAGGQVTCDNVEGDVQAGGSVTCDSVEGNVRAGADVHCDAVSGDVRADGSVECGDVEGSVTAGADVTCGNVGGDVTCGGILQSGQQNEQE